MWNSLTCLLALALPAAQGNELEIVNARPTYGFLGAERPKTGMLPGDVFHFAFDIKGMTTNAKGKASMTRMFRKRRLRPGARISVAISTPNTIAKVKRYKIRRGKAPRTRTLCRAPGAKATHC